MRSPVVMKKLLDTMEKKTEMKETECRDHIYVKSGYRIVRLEFEHIDYIESCNDYIKIQCNNQPKPILSLCSLKKLESVLPASDFIRVHRSYIVRKKSITILENRSIIFNKTRIPVSKSCLKDLQEYIQVCQ